MDFEQLLLQQVYKKNVELSGYMNQVDELNKDNKQLISNLKTQNQVNIEQKKKIEKMIKISKEVKKMISACDSMKPATKTKVLEFFATCEVLINSEDGHM